MVHYLCGAQMLILLLQEELYFLNCTSDFSLLSREEGTYFFCGA